MDKSILWYKIPKPTQRAEVWKHNMIKREWEDMGQNRRTGNREYGAGDHGAREQGRRGQGGGGQGTD